MLTRTCLLRTQVIAAAALHLAGKANDEPRHMNALVMEMLKQWFNCDNKETRRKVQDGQFLESLMETVRDAECSILFTIGFDFNMDLLLPTVTQVVKTAPRLAMLHDHVKFHQFSINTCNDIMQKDVTLVLQYSMRSIALTICEMYFKLARPGNPTAVKRPEPGAGGQPWFVQEGLPPEEWRAISGRFLSKLFQLKEAGQASKKPPPVAAADSGLTGLQLTGSPTEGAALSSAGGGLMASTAVVSSATVGEGGRDAVRSTAQKLPGPAAAVAGVKRPRGAGPDGGTAEAAFRGREGPRGAAGEVHARSTAPRGAGATLGMGPGPPPHAQQPHARSHVHKRPPQEQPHRPGRERAPPPKSHQAPPQAEDSGPEEGEIEEGEIV